MPAKSIDSRTVLDSGSVIASRTGTTVIEVPTFTSPFHLHLTFVETLGNRYEGRPRGDGDGMDFQIGTEMLGSIGGGSREEKFATFSGRQAYIQFRVYSISEDADPHLFWTVTVE